MKRSSGERGARHGLSGGAVRDERLSALQLAGGALIIVAALAAHRAAAEPVPGASLA